jgi:hypothetical protein
MGETLVSARNCSSDSFSVLKAGGKWAQPHSNASPE